MSIIKEINKHYQSNQLNEKISNSLKLNGISFKSLKQSDLNNCDELHIGGMDATLKLAKTAKLKKNSTILDIGSGIGGPARQISKAFNVNVYGIDLNFTFCKTAQLLSDQVELFNNIFFVQSNALFIPFADYSVDAVLLQHCMMNIKDKNTLLKECFRVLKYDGKLLIHEVTQGNKSPIYFPVPWSKHSSTSFLHNFKDLLILIKKTGFSELQWNNISEEAENWYKTQNKITKKPFFLGQQLIFNDEWIRMGKNAKKNLFEKRIFIAEGLFNKNPN